MRNVFRYISFLEHLFSLWFGVLKDPIVRLRKLRLTVPLRSTDLLTTQSSKCRVWNPVMELLLLSHSPWAT